MAVVLRGRRHVNELQLVRPGDALGAQRVVGQAGEAQTQRQLVAQHDQAVLDGRLLLGARARHALLHATQPTHGALLGPAVRHDEKGQLLGGVGRELGALVVDALGRAEVADRLVSRLVRRRRAVDRELDAALLAPRVGQQSPATGVQNVAAPVLGIGRAHQEGQKLRGRQRRKGAVDPPHLRQDQHQRDVGKNRLPNSAQPRDDRAAERVLHAGEQLPQHREEQAQRVEAQQDHAKIEGAAVVQAKEQAEKVGHGEKNQRPEAGEHRLDLGGDLCGVLDRGAVVLAKKHRLHRLDRVVAGQDRRGEEVVDRHHDAHRRQGLGAAEGQQDAVSHDGLQRHAAAREALRRAAAQDLGELLVHAIGPHQRKRVGRPPKVQHAHGKAGPAGQAHRKAHAKDPQLKEVKRAQGGHKVGHAGRHRRAHGQVLRPVERDRLEQDARREVRDVARRRAVHVVDGALRELALAAHQGHDRLGGEGVYHGEQDAKDGEKTHA